MRNLIREIHRRSLWQVLGIYLALSWIALQVVDVLSNNVGLPAWVGPTAFALLLVGLPIVVGTAFVQEGMTTRGQEHPTTPPDEATELQSPAPSTPGRRHRFMTWRNALVGGVGAFALLGLVTAAWLFMRASGIGPAGTLVAKGILDERERLVLADFDSATDTVLARTVTETVRRALAESSALRFVERDQLAETLRRMGRDARTTAIDEETAREIAIRDGLKGFVGGMVDRVGTGYVLSADLVLAESGETALSHQETARDDADLINAIDRLSRRFRERAGESLRDVNASPRLRAVTTSSLTALQKYVQGRIVYDRGGDDDAAITLYKEAIGIDTTFAEAYRALAVVYSNGRRGRSLVVDAMEHAMRHQDRLSEAERARLQAYYQQTVTRDREATVAAYRRSLELDPDSAGLNNLAVAYTGLRRFEEAEEAFGLAIAHGNDIWQTHSGRVRMLYALGRTQEARAALEDARAAVPDSAIWDRYEFDLDVADGMYDAADSVLTAYEARYRRDPGTAILAPLRRGRLAALRGRLGAAEDALGRIMAVMEARSIRALYLTAAATVSAFRLEAGDVAGAHAVVDEALRVQPLDSIAPLDRPYFALANAYSRLGDPARARGLLERWETEVDPELDDPLGTGRLTSDAWVALAEGRPEEAVERFRQADEIAGGCTICGLYEIGHAYDEAGNADSAIAVYERFLDTPWYNRTGEDGRRGPILERLGQLHDARGDLEDAAKYYAMFVELWADADDVLQPRVQAAQARLEAILREIG